jgi:dTDP-4-dehydrorhamnose 3,5-epimerase
MVFSVEKLEPFTDSRGIFLKLMEDGTYPKNYEIRDKCFRPIQTFLTVTKKNAIRGMHFYEHSSADEDIILQSSKEKFSSVEVARGGISKSFVVISGEIFFAAIDLQRGNKSFGAVETLVVNAFNQVSIPRMVATGFQVISNEATILYFLDSLHKPDKDISINPNSCGINWPLTLGEISSRDSTAITLEKYFGLYK